MGSRHADWVPPDSFDEYRLVKALGRGSLGQIWLAHDTVLDRLVAVKFIAELPAHDDIRRQLLTEARAAARVQHPNIIAVYRVGQIGSRSYLISEYVRGDSLDQLARPVAWPRLLHIAIGLARGLAAAHRQGVLHGDLALASAIVSETGEVKLRNFALATLLPLAAPPYADAPPNRAAVATPPGALDDPMIAPRARSELSVSPPDRNAKTVEVPAGAPAPAAGGDIALPEGTPPESPRASESPLGLPHAKDARALFPSPDPLPSVSRNSSPSRDPMPSITSAGAATGTPASMSPEAWRGEPVTPRSDVYALGALLYALGAGDPPHRGDSPEVVQGAALAGDAPPLASAAPGIDPGFAAVVDRCLRRDPAERFASGDAVRGALEALASGDQPAARVRARSSRERLSPRLRRAVLLGAAFALCVLFARFGYHTLGGTSSPPPIDAAPVIPASPGAPAQRSPDALVQPPPDASALVAGSQRLGAAPGRCPEGMVPVPAGTFRMGSPEGEGDTDEQPQHEVTLSAYCIDKTEVTVAAYAACVAAGGCSAAPLTVNSPNYSEAGLKRASLGCNRKDRRDHPINCVDWDQAAAYCTWNGKRLPTEAEWEYAARGNDGRVYPWGSRVPSAKQMKLCGDECLFFGESGSDDDNGWRPTAPVGSYPEGASPFGALDLAGNVREWAADWYGPYTKQAETNPQGPSTGTSRVSRGGGGVSRDTNSKARAADRDWPDPTVRGADLGFRCARGN